MKYLIICSTSFLIALITLFSGFGLGTVLMPVFAIFFPLSIAITATAVIHLANNLFKALLVGKLAKKNVALKFGIPAGIASAFGAYLFSYFASWSPLFTYTIFQKDFQVTLLGVVVGGIVILSSLLELVPSLSHLSFPTKYIPLGGAISGFFGGVSGNQGMFRSAFLIRSGLGKGEFIGTGIICAIIVDSVRLIVYGWAIFVKELPVAISTETQGILLAASLTAFFGSYLGAQWMDKITFKVVQMLVGIMLMVLGLALFVGFI